MYNAIVECGMFEFYVVVDHMIYNPLVDSGEFKFMLLWTILSTIPL